MFTSPSQEIPCTASTRGLRRWFDFHIHTRASDGECSPQEVLAEAREHGFEGISITDHDTVAAYGELDHGCGATGRSACAGVKGEKGLSPRGAPPAGLRLLAGLEVTTRLGDGEAHILGYFPEGIPGAVTAYSDGILKRRRRRMATAIRRLREKGFEISWDDCAREAQGQVVSLTHLASVLVKKRYMGRVQRAYARCLGRDTVPLPDDRAEDVVEQLKALGAVTVWAHPDRNDFSESFERLVEAGLDGVEVLVPRRRPAEAREMASRTRARSLLVTGGSDSHGRRPGAVIGDFRVQAAAIPEFIERIGWDRASESEAAP